MSFHMYFKQARVVLYNLSKEKLVLKFDASASTNMNWFGLDRLQQSPWQNISTSPKNFFSIEGSCWSGTCRSFFINNKYGGCDVDAGWLMIGGSRGCSWENRFPGNSFQYSNVGTYVTWMQYGKVHVFILTK
jgi:hypothetical protein